MNTAFIFPGQGSQFIGMGQDFYNSFPLATQTFQEVDDILGYKLSNIIFSGPEDQLTLTVNAQPALMVVSMSILNVLKQETGKTINSLCNYVAGHSLGEYTALAAAGSLSLADTARLLQIRGKSMQEACPADKGTMAACIGIGLSQLEELIASVDGKLICDIANDNIDGQIVISGENEIIDRMIAILKDLGYKAIKLKVSAPFHSRLMKPAAVKMELALTQTIIHRPQVPIISNVTAQVVVEPDKICQNLITQVCGRIRWRETLDLFAQMNIENIVEIGSGKVLSGMIKKNNKYNFNLKNISTVTELKDLLSTIS